MKEEQLHSQEERRVDIWATLLGALDFVGFGLGLLVLALCVGSVVMPVAPEAIVLEQKLEELAMQRLVAVSSRHYDARELLQRSDAAQSLLRSTLAGPAAVAQIQAEKTVWPSGLVQALHDEGNVARLLPPEDLTGKALHGAVQLVWRAAARGNVTVKCWQVLRAAPGGEFAAVAEVPTEQATWTDRLATPGTLFSYRVVAVCADPLLAATLPYSDPSVPVTLGSEADLRWNLVDADATAARFLVERWQGERFVAKDFMVLPGETLGSTDSATGLDFGTGLKLLAIRVELEARSRTVDAVVFDSEGRVSLIGGRPKTVSETREENVPTYCLTLQPQAGGAPLELRVGKR